jgi:hypothetical protein
VREFTWLCAKKAARGHQRRIVAARSTTAALHKENAHDAYRFHFEPANLAPFDDPGSKTNTRLFTRFIMQRERATSVQGGTPLLRQRSTDIGINTSTRARYLFRDEPADVFGKRILEQVDVRFSEVRRKRPPPSCTSPRCTDASFSKCTFTADRVSVRRGG